MLTGLHRLKKNKTEHAVLCVENNNCLQANVCIIVSDSFSIPVVVALACLLSNT